MSRVIYLYTGPAEQARERAKLYEVGTRASFIHTTDKLSVVIKFISVVGKSDLDLNYPTIFIISDDVGDGSITAAERELDALVFEDIRTLLEEHYRHLNVLVYKESLLNMLEVRATVEKYHRLLKNRLLRMKTWAGLNNEEAVDCPMIYSMPNCLKMIMNTSDERSTMLREYILKINKAVNFEKLLSCSRPSFSFYQSAIGSWGFIAHELSCDESTVCAYAMFKHTLAQLPPSSPLMISNNDLMSFLFAIRDSYRGGNAFHNFRHAVDVLQATFYLLIRLGALPTPEGFSVDIEGVPTSVHQPTIPALLDAENCLTLLLASVGHDVGHPGLTNDFLAKFKAPLNTVFSSKAVLESFHSSWFKRCLRLHWPVFLQEPWNKLQTETILATDMASHFGYVKMIQGLVKTGQQLKAPSDVVVLMSIIIKCADISNVTRPLNVSSRWGIILTREFNEIAELSKHLSANSDLYPIVDPREEPHFPLTYQKAIEESPQLPKSQMFFISHFADAMFKEVAALIPEFAFMYEVLQANTTVWKSAIEPAAA
ncbi:3',5'-cyclic-nucleotide phosphodiesterase PDE2 [Cyberlindnera jadinii NRRL Y-1542]|uniref:Phosphodiesterase n=1 Tax=Cyberlindnera jadinii (strain ATCC 18201 / CBS 1600 / BCRC 20928 / JCM 3617 / NBRC 0987 / NRRL Y-1542) TaxID=983966 RepID=A0A1E4RVY8_CYBJN|nr:HD-domain/PDEase-like protein [Cyberlindnera jadinii NRRL Y-1542]ODV71245.1 HD-domain/PDEase-like protein [Cyberlindnera jadinii NRRL Y-1542]